MPEVWGGDGASGAGAASGDASGVGVAGSVCAGPTVGGRWRRGMPEAGFATGGVWFVLGQARGGFWV